MALLNLSSETGLEVVILLGYHSYGPGVKGNLRLLMRFLEYKVLFLL